MATPAVVSDYVAIETALKGDVISPEAYTSFTVVFCKKSTSICPDSVVLHPSTNGISLCYTNGSLENMA